MFVEKADGARRWNLNSQNCNMNSILFEEIQKDAGKNRNLFIQLPAKGGHLEYYWIDSPDLSDDDDNDVLLPPPIPTTLSFS